MAQDAIKNHADFIWSVADLLRGDYKRSEYGKVILPLTVLRRMDCVLEATKEDVLKRYERLKGRAEHLDPVLESVADEHFYNTSPLDFRRLLDDPNQIAGSLKQYIAAFSPGAREVINKFDFDVQIARLARADLLYLVLSRFADLDLHPDVVSSIEMGYIYEELVRRFSELSNETAGEHFTPREVIRLMVDLLFADDDEALTGAKIKTLFDPACGTGGMLSVAEDYLREHNPAAFLEVYGQELNDETYAICRSDMMLKGQDPSHIFCGNSFSDDGHEGKTFDYMLANPPFGVEWKKVADPIRTEHETRGFDGRFGAGLPRINDGSFLFLQHMISKMKPVKEGGTRLAIVFNGSPLFTGAAGSGESEIRRWILENDWLEGIVALPDQLFYNTGISTYFWILSNRKSEALRGKVILLDARDQWEKMRKSLGDKRKQISPGQIKHITELYMNAVSVAADEGHPDHGKVKIFSTRDFGYHRITVERPLKLRFEITEDTLGALDSSKPLAKWDRRDAFVSAVRDLLGTVWWTKKEASAALLSTARSSGALWPSTASCLKAIWSAVSVSDPEGEIQRDRDGNPEPHPDLRDYENVPLDEDVDAYFAREVTPHVPDAWIDRSKTRVGYEIPFTRHFYVYTPPRPLADIDAELRDLESEIQKLLGEVTR